jgi:WD40 repeat protein
VAVWHIEAREVVERYVQGNAFASGAAFSNDGSLLAVGYLEGSHPVTIWDRASRESFVLGEAGFPTDFSFSPDDEYLAFTKRGTPGFEVWSMEERTLVYQNGSAKSADFNSDGLLVYTVRLADEGGAPTAGIEVRIVDPESWGVVDAFTTELTDPNFAAGAANAMWSADGRYIAVQDSLDAVVLDAETGDELSRTQDVDLLFRPEWLSAGAEFVVAGVLQPRVIDAASGVVRLELLGLGEGIGSWDYDAVPASTLVAAAALGPGTGIRAGDTVLFETSPVIGEVGGWVSKVEPWRGTGYALDGRAVIAGGFLDASVLSAEAVDGSDEVLLQGGSTSWFPDLNANGTFFSFADAESLWTLRAADSGDVIYEAPVGWQILGASWDGAKAVIRRPFDADPTSELGCGPSRIVSTRDGSLISELSAVECSAHPFFSPDGTLLFTASFFGETALFDVATGEVLVDFTGTKYNSLGAAFTPDGGELVIALEPVFVLDVATLLSGAPMVDAERLVIPANALQGLSVSPDAKWVATSTRDEPLKVWDLENGTPFGEFGRDLKGGFHTGDFHPSKPHLLVATPPGEIRVYTLDADELVAIAEAGLSRDMTEAECKLYFRSPCP